MRKPDRNKHKAGDAESFINNAEGLAETPPWERRLRRRYDKDTGKVINVRLPEHYAECLQWLAEQDSRSQHGELVYLLQEAIDNGINKVSK